MNKKPRKSKPASPKKKPEKSGGIYFGKLKRVDLRKVFVHSIKLTF